MKTIEYAPFLADFDHEPEQPLFLRIVAPPEPGRIETYNLTFLEQPVGYALHWIKRHDGGTDRQRCTGSGCQLCAEGLVPSVMFAGLVVSAVPRFAIAQMSQAVSKHVVRAALKYRDGLFKRDPEAEFEVLGLSAALSPIFSVQAKRTASGPRYKVAARRRSWTADPVTGEPLGLRDWFDTVPGRAWLDKALANTAPVIRPYALEPEAFDVMRLVFPEDYIDDGWEDDSDE